jgi:hypothetical protein
VSKKTAAKKASKNGSRRSFYVFTALTGALTMTGALLVALSPQPLRPDSATSLSAVEGADPMGAVYATKAPIALGRWKYIYVHHSRSAFGSAAQEAMSPVGTTDHFVITNGNGAGDGEVQITPLWAGQQSGGSPTGTGTIDPACISICVVGDFDQSLPTTSQHHRLTQLINSLQGQLRLPTHCVIMLDQPGTVASVGRHFPVSDFRSQLLR